MSTLAPQALSLLLFLARRIIFAVDALRDLAHSLPRTTRRGPRTPQRYDALERLVLPSTGAGEGYFCPARLQPPVALLVILPGIGDRASFWREAQQLLAEGGIASLAIEYGGPLSLSPARLQVCALAAVRCLRSRAPDGVPLFLLGFSLGTGVAAECAGVLDPAPAGLILCQPYTSLRDAAGRVAQILGSITNTLPFRAIRRSIPDVWRTAEALRRIPCPLLLVHATGDALFPATMACALQAAAAADRELPTHPPALELVEGLSHNALYQLVPPAYWDPILAFIDRLSGPAEPSARVGSADGAVRDPGVHETDGRVRWGRGARSG